ncbi:MAG: chromosome segregation protein SMC, partial [Thermoanaerobaculales bacterium]|nr:chromosome segregation protein SMC [Thermoanaerobaculales bacterium]
MATVRLESLKLRGFKSFPDEVELTFPGPVSAIIGPNGCGKSNVVDAMLWVLGEQSPSLLRLKNMGDVVFSGASERKPAGTAEVVLMLQSQDGRWADRDGRLEIRRRVLRSGPSEYRMNGKVARLKDIMDELLSVGLGTRNYAIIEQSRVGQVLSARPTDRRVLLEEAAGITRYKVRKHESELKLVHTRQNLLRLEDVIDEVNRSLRQLKRQAKQAQRFEKTQTDLVETLRNLHVIEAHALAARRADTLKERAQCQNEVAAAASALGGSEADLAAARKELEQARTSVETARGDVSRLDTSRERLETFLERSADLLDNLKQSLVRNLVDASSAGDTRREMETRLTEAKSQVETFRDALLTVNERVEEAKAEEKTAREKLEQQEEAAGRTREDLLRTISTLTNSRNRLGELQREQDRLSYSGTQLEQERDRIEARRQEVSVRHEEALVAGKDALEVVSGMEESRSVLVEERSRIREDAQETKQNADSLSHQTWEFRHRLSGVERELARHTAVSDRLAEVLPEDCLAGRLIDYLHPKAGASQFLDRVWGELLELPVVHSKAMNPERLHRLASLEERTRIVVAGPASDPPPWPVLDGAEPVLATAGIDEAHRNWILRALPPAYLCPNRETAQELAEAHPRVVILDGEGVLWCGRMVEPASGAVRRKGALALRQEREDLSSQIDDTANRAQTSTTKHRELLERLDKVENQLAAVDRDVVQAEQERARASAVEQSLNQELQRLEEEAGSLAQETERTAKQTEVLGEKRTRLEKEVVDLETRSQELEQRLDEATQDLESRRETSAETLRRLDRWRAEHNLAAERESAATREFKRLQTEDQLLEGRQKTLATQKNEFERSLASTEDEVVRSRTKLVEEQALLASSRQEERRRTEEVEQVGQKVGALEKEVRNRRDKHEIERETLHKAEMEMTAAEGEWVRLRDLCLADLGASPETLTQEELPEKADPEELRTRADDLRSRLEKLGPVNLLALKEADELAERSTFLGKQRTDLIGALKSLDETIKEIDNTCTERFLSTFEQVNTIFGETFSHLFGGGAASLELVDEDDPLESGLDITAQPPGKKNQSVQLLSGGEKALTALA